MKKLIEEFIKEVFIDNNIDIKYDVVSDSNRKELCDYQINSVFSISKELEKNPEEIGNILVDGIINLKDFSKYFKEVNFVKPGFINIIVSDELITQVLNNNINNNYGIEEVKDETYFLDYGGPNIAKPLHIGHLRPAIIGESIKRILNLKGYKTISDAHFGDYGLQIGEVIYGIKRDNKQIDDIDINYLNKIYPEVSSLCKENEEILSECKRITKELQDGNEEYNKYFNKIVEVSLSDIKRLYKYLNISFDLWKGESDSKEFVKPLIDLLKQKNLLKLDTGAYIVEVKKEEDTKEMPPAIIIKSDGAMMYSTTDLASIYERVKEYNPDHILYVVDARQDIHFEQVFRVSDLSGMISYDKLEHIKFGTINGEDNKPFKTRSGGTLKLDDLIKLTKETFISKRKENENMDKEDLDIIVNSILKFADLSNNREKSYIFDISKFSDTVGKTGPYIIYTALRIKKLLKDNEYNKKEINSVIYNKDDRNLRMKLLEFDKYLTMAVDSRMPHYICEYVYDLSNLLNTFYQNNSIKEITDKDKINDLLNILEYSFNTIKLSLNILGINIPKIM